MLNLQQRLDRFAYIYDWVEFLPEKWFLAQNRQKIIPPLKGKLLEVGVGTGKNLPYYNNGAEVIAVDLSLKMLAKAVARLKKLGKQNIILEQADAENLPFPDHTFDWAVATCVFCTVQNPVQGFAEIKRVLKPGGQAIFLEHVQSENSFRSKWQEFLSPLTEIFFCCHLNRRTWENIEQGGLKIVEDQKLALGDVVRFFRCRK